MLLDIDAVMEQYFTKPNGGKIISRDCLYRLCRNGKIPARKLDAKWVFSSEALDRWFSCDDFFEGKVMAKKRSVPSPGFEPIPE